MKVTVRGERVSDYSQIACVNYEAFLGWHPDNPYVAEPVIADLLRHNALFDPELSLVAELDGEVVGHVLLSPFRFVVLGKEQPGVVLGPVGVRPGHQKAGIGKMLIEEGHKRAAAKGFALSVLCGHPEYYPRFGYRTGLFSLAGARVRMDPGGFDCSGLEERPVSARDVPWIVEAWEREHGRDSLALFPGTGVSSWSSHGPGTRCSVVLRQGTPLGYVRYEAAGPLRVKEILRNNGELPDLLAFILARRREQKPREVYLPLPEEAVRGQFPESERVDIVDEQVANEAFMIKVLDDSQTAVKEYCLETERKSIKPGIVVFPPMFDVDDGRHE